MKKRNPKHAFSQVVLYVITILLLLSMLLRFRNDAALETWLEITPLQYTRHGNGIADYGAGSAGSLPGELRNPGFSPLLAGIGAGVAASAVSSILLRAPSGERLAGSWALVDRWGIGRPRRVYLWPFGLPG